VQTPLEQRAVGDMHRLPQAPQFIGSVWWFASQPVAALPSQSPKFGKHAMPHDPLTHVDVALGGRIGQAVVQLPQRVTSL